MASREQAVEAMHVAARYFALREPSSPVPILLREAQTASAKSFYELVSDLVPDTAGSAFVSLGNEPWFEVYLSTLDARNPAARLRARAGRDEAAEDTGLGDEHETATDPAMPADGEVDQTGETDAPTADEDTAAGAEEAREEAQEQAAAAAGAEPPSGDAGEAAEAAALPPEVQDLPGQSKFVANSRPEAVALMEKVLEYYRVAEPSSPVPLLVERAIDLSSKSFIELLGRVLPEGSLKVKPPE